MNTINYSRWIMGKLVVLLLLLLQFYLAKHYSEPYPCVIMPAFTYAHPKNQAIKVYSYSVWSIHQTDTNRVDKAALFPHCPPAYIDFFFAKVLASSNGEKKAFCEKCWQQALLQFPDTSDQRLQIRLEVDHYKPLPGQAEIPKTLLLNELVCTKKATQ